MKIGLVTTKPGVVTGVTIVMNQVAEGLKQRGYDVDLLHPEPTKLSGVKVLGYAIQYALLKERMKSYDIVFGNGVGLAGAVDLPISKVDTIHSTSEGANAALNTQYGALDPKEIEELNEVLGSICNATVVDLPESFRTKVGAFDMDKLVAADSEVIVTVSEQIRNEILTYFDVPEKKIVTIPNAVEDFWLESNNQPGEKPRIVYSGRAGYTPINIFLKGFDRVASVFKSFPLADKLCILHIGNEQYIEPIQKVVNNLGAEYHQNLTQREIAKELRPGDIYLNASRYEAFGLSLIEAMACGLVPVTFSTGVVPEIIQNGVNGFVVTKVEEMRDRVDELLNDPSRAQAMGNAARETIREKYNIHVMVDGYAKLIDALETKNTRA